MSAVKTLCQRAILIQGGKITKNGTVQSVLSHYQGITLKSAVQDDLRSRRDRSGDGSLRLTKLRIEDESGAAVDRVASGQTVIFVLEYACGRDLRKSKVDAGISFGIDDQNLLSLLYASYQGIFFEGLPTTGEIRCRVEDLPLAPGSYRIGARVLVNGVEADWPRDGVGNLTVESGDYFGTGYYGHGSGAPLLIRSQWAATSCCSNASA
jgi:lipopolysaccharide transport system ATP-binding protein